MKRRALTMSLMQLFSSPVFYLSVVGVALMCYISAWKFLMDAPGTMSVSYYLDLLLGLSQFTKLIFLFAAFPFVASFCSDWRSQYIKSIVIRTGIKKYVWSRILTCFVSGLLTVFIGVILFMIVLSFQQPLFPIEHIEQNIYPPYAPLALGEIPVLYVLAYSVVFSMAAAFWTIVGLAVSAFIPIPFVAITSPVIAGYLLEELTRGLPIWLNTRTLARSGDVFHQGPLISFVYFCLIFMLFAFLAGLVFHYQVRRRIRNEVI